MLCMRSPNLPVFSSKRQRNEDSSLIKSFLISLFMVYWSKELEEYTMTTKSHMSRMTIDVAEEDHKQLKALAAVLGKSMRELVVEWIHQNIYSAPKKEKAKKTKIPNRKTLEAIKELEEGRGTRCKSLDDFWKKVGIDPNA